MEERDGGRDHRNIKAAAATGTYANSKEGEGVYLDFSVEARGYVELERKKENCDRSVTV